MATVVAEPKVELPKPVAAMLRPAIHDLKDESQVRRRWFFTAKEGATKDDLRYPEFYSAIASRLSRHDIITVLGPDEDWEVEVCVEAATTTGAEVSIRKNYPRTGVKQSFEALDDRHHVEWRAGKGWCVIRRLPNREPEIFIAGHGTAVGAKMEWVRRQPRPVA